jgi:methionine-rich copper-binding protein CopC
MEPLNLLYGAPEYVKVGPYGTAEGSCTNIGFTDGGVEIIPKLSIEKRRVDQRLGAVAADAKEADFSLKITLAEASLDNLRIAMGLPSAALSGGVLSVGSNIGVQYLTVYLQGPGPGASNATRHVKVQKCYVDGPDGIKMNKAKNVLQITLELLEDTTQAANEEWMKVTDASGDTTAPTVSSTSPTDGATGTAVDANITAEFSEAIQAADVNGTYFKLVKATTGTGVAGALTLSADKQTVTFNPTSNLDAAAAYIFIISQGVRDLAGNKLAADTYVNFTTA